MEKFNQIAKDIRSIFRIVCVISDERELFYEDSSVLLEKLDAANKLISTINLYPILEEIWEFSLFPDRENQIISIVNNNFEKLIAWKPDTESILEMNDKLTEDLKSFYKRQACIDRDYELSERSIINSVYKEIGQRAYKLDDELSDILNK